MKLKQLVIKRQNDQFFSIVAKVENQNGHVETFILTTAKTPQQLQKPFLHYLQDKESLQVDILYQKKKERLA